MAAVKTASAQPKKAPVVEPANHGTSEKFGAQVQELKVTGHLMALPPGLFCFVNELNAGAGMHNGMPGVRVSPPPIGGQNVEISGFRSDGWLSAEGDAVLVRIKNQPAQVLVTIYQLANMPDSSPRLQVRQLLGEAHIASNGAPAAAATPERPAAPESPADITAHIQSRGDVGIKFGEWMGEKGSQNWIEGFAIHAPDGIAPAELTYQAVLGRGWLSPWVDAGQYCGSRGMALPLLGLRVRLSGGAAEQYDISYAATFIGGASSGPVGNDETCEAENLAPLESFQIILTPRGRKGTKPKGKGAEPRAL
ncbi:MAG: hypothetical protein KGQ26_01665 [Rhodospirillales bacterium]|nr:hypothetical protein [Rhodospirillales bacterium]